MNPMIRLILKVGGLICGTLVVSLPALATTNEESVRLLKLTEFVLPVYPEGAKQEGLSAGTVTTIIAHDGAGRPTDVMVLDATHVRFAEAVREAVHGWKFSPDPAAGTTSAPLVRFFFSAKGVVLMESPGMRSVLTREMPSLMLQIPTFGSLDAPPKPLEQAMPVFPQALRGRVNAGTVTVSFYVDETGRVRAPIVTEATSPEFAAAALAAVGQWRYETPRQNGRPVVAVENWNFRFGGPSSS